MEILKKILGSIPIKGWIIVLVIIMGFMMWHLGTIGSGTDLIKKLIFDPYDKAIVELQNEKEVLKKNLDQINKKVFANEQQIKQQDAKIDGIKTKISESDRRVEDVEKKMGNIVVPTGSNDLVAEFKSRGLNSTRVRSRK